MVLLYFDRLCRIWLKLRITCYDTDEPDRNEIYIIKSNKIIDIGRQFGIIIPIDAI